MRYELLLALTFLLGCGKSQKILYEQRVIREYTKQELKNCYNYIKTSDGVMLISEDCIDIEKVYKVGNRIKDGVYVHKLKSFIIYVKNDYIYYCNDERESFYLGGLIVGKLLNKHFYYLVEL